MLIMGFHQNKEIKKCVVLAHIHSLASDFFLLMMQLRIRLYNRLKLDVKLKVRLQEKIAGR